MAESGAAYPFSGELVLQDATALRAEASRHGANPAVLAQAGVKGMLTDGPVQGGSWDPTTGEAVVVFATAPFFVARD